jgi:hypothetical protein
MNFKEIKSHADACRVLGKDASESTNIHDQLDDIADAINILDGDFLADFKDPSQKKWRPFFIVDSSGFRFDGSYYGGSRSLTTVGSRLCQFFKSEEAADYFGKEFFALHEKCFNKRRPAKGIPVNFREIKTHSDACKVLGKDETLSVTTDQKINDVFNAVNKLKGFKADFNNEEEKWRPYFRMDSSGFRFLSSGYGHSRSDASVGSRLCHYVSSKEEADHLGVQFLELHKEHYQGE